MKKTLSAILALAMLLSVFTGLSIPASAAKTDAAPTGIITYGETGDCLWSYDSVQQSLNIYGTGRMADYTANSQRPWDNVVANVEAITVRFGTGVSYVGKYAFSRLPVYTIVFDSLGTVAADRAARNKNGVQEIGAYAFAECDLLNTITLPSSVKTIGERAFKNDHDIAHVNMEWGLQTIGREAFYDCPKLSYASIPSSVISIGDESFGYFIDGNNREVRNGDFAMNSYTGSPAAVYCEDNGFQYYLSLYHMYTDYGEVRFDPETKTLRIENCGGDEWSVESSLYDGIWGEIKTIRIDDRIRKIGPYAFAYLVNMTHTYFPDGINEIGDYAFFGCRNMDEVVSERLQTVGKYAFADCPRFKLLDVPERLENIGQKAFGYAGVPLKAMSDFAMFSYEGNAAAKSYCEANGLKYYTFMDAPDAPMLKNVSNGIRISWTKVPGVLVRVNRYIDAAAGTMEGIAAVLNGNSYVDTNVSYGKNYSYCIQYYTAPEPYRTLSNPGSRAAIIRLKAPVLKSINNVYGGQTISWYATAYAKQYYVYYMGTDGWKYLATATTTSYTNKKVEDKKTYKYTVVAVNGNSTSCYDPDGISKQYLAAPAVTKMQNVLSGIQVVWTKTPGAKKYRLYHGIGTNKIWGAVGDFTANYGTDKLKDDYSGKKIYYTVRAIDANGNFLTGYNPVGWSTIYVAAVKDISFEHKVDAIRVKWAIPKNTKYFDVYRKKSGDAHWSYIATTQNSYYDDNKNLVSGTYYRYTVVASDKNKNSAGYYTDGVQYRYLAAPQYIRATNLKKGVNVTWKKSPGAAYYQVLRRKIVGQRAGNWQPIKVVAASLNQYTDTTAVKGTTYQYSVRCVNYNTRTKNYFAASAFRAGVKIKRDR